MPAGVVTFTRQCVDKFPDWKNLGDYLTDIHVSAEGTIEDDGDGLLQVDFANKYMGGRGFGDGSGAGGDQVPDLSRDDSDSIIYRVSGEKRKSDNERL